MGSAAVRSRNVVARKAKIPGEGTRSIGRDETQEIGLDDGTERRWPEQ